MGYICYDVRCPNCGEAFYETTEAFDPAKMTTGEMLRFKKKYGPEGYNWSLPFSDYDMAEAIVCPECCGPLAPNGAVRVEPLTGDVRREAGGEFLEISGSEISKRQKEEEERMARIVSGGGEPILDHIIETMMRIDPSIDSEQGPPEPEPEDPMAKYLNQRGCPYCGWMGNEDEYKEHIKKHPKEIREEIEKQPEPAVVAPTEQPQGKSKGKVRGIFGGKGKKGLPEPEGPEPKKFNCPLCEKGFDHNHEYEAHMKSHPLDGVRQVVQ